MKKTKQDQAKLKDGINDDVKQQLLQMKKNLAVETEKEKNKNEKTSFGSRKKKKKTKVFQSCQMKAIQTGESIKAKKEGDDALFFLKIDPQQKHRSV